jgi:hypothetical protein
MGIMPSGDERKRVLFSRCLASLEGALSTRRIAQARHPRAAEGEHYLVEKAAGNRQSVAYLRSLGTCPLQRLGDLGLMDRQTGNRCLRIGPERDSYRDCPEAEIRGCTGRGVGAVSIGSFEGSRWRLRWTRSAMGFESTFGWKLLY